MADSTDPVQSDVDQGGQGNGGSPYDDYLARVPEEYRSDIEPIFKEWDSNTTRKFQEAAEARRAFEPYEPYVKDREPDQVALGLQFVDALQDPKAIKEWYDQYAQQNGLTAQTTEEEYVDPTVQALVDRQLAAQLGPVASQVAEFQAWREHQEQQAAVAAQRDEIESQLASLKSQHPDEFDRGLVDKLLPQYIESDPHNAVQKAFEDSRAIVAQVQKQWTDSKASQPPGAVSGGTANGTAERPEGMSIMKWASQQAEEQMRGSRGA